MTTAMETPEQAPAPTTALGEAGGRTRRADNVVVTALALTWALGAASYYVLPSIGPFHVDPGAFAHLRPTAIVFSRFATFA